MPLKCLVNGLTTNHPSDFDSHDLLALRVHHRCLLDLLALSRPRRRSICRLHPQRKLYRHQEILLGDRLASVVEAQVTAKHHDLHRAVVVQDRKMEGCPTVHLPRPESRGWKQSQSLRHLAQSMRVLVHNQILKVDTTYLVAHGKSSIVRCWSPHICNKTNIR